MALDLNAVTAIEGKDGYTLNKVLRLYEAKRAAERAEKEASKDCQRMQNIIPDDMLNGVALDITVEQYNAWKHGRIYQPQAGDGIDDEDVQEKIRASKNTANKDMAMLKAALNHVFNNPIRANWRQLQRYKKADGARILFLTEAETQNCLLYSTGAFKDLFRAAFLTGCRIGELKPLQVGQFEKLATTGTYILDIKESKTGPRIQHLSHDAAEFFLSIIEGKKSSAPLLPNDNGKHWITNEHDKGGMTPLKRNALVNGIELPEKLVFYSARHYYISKALISGFNVIALGRNVGTSVKMIEQHYAKFLISDVHSMLNAVEV